LIVICWKPQIAQSRIIRAKAGRPGGVREFISIDFVGELAFLFDAV
jgi:hypothetical protein